MIYQFRSKFLTMCIHILCESLTNNKPYHIWSNHDRSMVCIRIYNA